MLSNESNLLTEWRHAIGEVIAAIAPPGFVLLCALWGAGSERKRCLLYPSRSGNHRRGYDSHWATWFIYTHSSWDRHPRNEEVVSKAIVTNVRKVWFLGEATVLKMENVTPHGAAA